MLPLHSLFSDILEGALTLIVCFYRKMALPTGGNLWPSIMPLALRKGGVFLCMIMRDTMPLVFSPRQLWSVFLLSVVSLLRKSSFVNILSIFFVIRFV